MLKAIFNKEQIINVVSAGLASVIMSELKPSFTAVAWGLFGCTVGGKLALDIYRHYRGPK